MLLKAGGEPADEVHIEIDGMDSGELDALVEKYDLAVPEDWFTRDRAAKAAWLEANFGNVEEEHETPAVPLKAGQPVKAPKTNGKKTANAPANTLLNSEKSGSKAKSESTAQTALHGEVIQDDDLIAQVAGEIENLKEEDIDEAILQLKEIGEFNFFKLGGVLSLAQANHWFGGFNTLRQYVEKKHGIEYRRAVYWIAIYNGLVDSKIPWNKVAHLGWSKLSALVRIMPEVVKDLDHWVMVAASATVLELRNMVKEQLGGVAANLSPGPTTSKTFKLHDDQKQVLEAAIAKAKEISGTKVDVKALEYICMEFISTANPSTVQQLSHSLKKLGVDDSLKAFDAAFPDCDLTVGI